MIFSLSSLVNTLTNNSLSVSAFSCADFAFVPSCLVKVGIICLVFGVDFAYLQNDFGFFLILHANFSQHLVSIPLSSL